MASWRPAGARPQTIGATWWSTWRGHATGRNFRRILTQYSCNVALGRRPPGNQRRVYRPTSRCAARLRSSWPKATGSRGERRRRTRRRREPASHPRPQPCTLALCPHALASRRGRPPPPAQQPSAAKKVQQQPKGQQQPKAQPSAARVDQGSLLSVRKQIAFAKAYKQWQDEVRCAPRGTSVASPRHHRLFSSRHRPQGGAPRSKVRTSFRKVKGAEPKAGAVNYTQAATDERKSARRRRPANGTRRVGERIQGDARGAEALRR
eukprot:992669-Prymnesium_polylepis.2